MLKKSFKGRKKKNRKTYDDVEKIDVYVKKNSEQQKYNCYRRSSIVTGHHRWKEIFSRNSPAYITRIIYSFFIVVQSNNDNYYLAKIYCDKKKINIYIYKCTRRYSFSWHVYKCIFVKWRNEIKKKFFWTT